MGKLTGKTGRLVVMVALTGSFFVVEITVGYISNSLALISDSYHMLSDVMALIIGLASVRISRWVSPKNTYGWARAEVLGALINSVFMLALCFTLLLEAIQRLVTPEATDQPLLVLIVGVVGLAINLVGLLLFCGHAHSHGGSNQHGHAHGGGNQHSHSHGSGDHHGHSHAVPQASSATGDVETLGHGISVTSSQPAIVTSPVIVTQDGVPVIQQPAVASDHHHHKNTASQLNMRGVMLHVMGDALGSVFVILNALLMMYASGDWRYYVDPITSIILITILTTTSIPLLRDSSLILLQTVPVHIRVFDLKERLLREVAGVLAVHEFHVWQLAGTRIIASAHILCQSQQQYMAIAGNIKQFFHNQGIHSTTIQPEFVEAEPSDNVKSGCYLDCGPDKLCFPDTCCNNPNLKQLHTSESMATLRHRYVNMTIDDSDVTTDTRF